MIGEWHHLAAVLERDGLAARVAVAATRGSTPREVGAALVLDPAGGFRGTIGGGALEWRFLAAAGRDLMRAKAMVRLDDVPLGPEIGQCCGGRVTVMIEVLDREALAEARRLAAAEAAGVFATRGEIRDGRLVREILGDGAPEPGVYGDGVVVERFGDDRRDLLLFGAGHVGRALVLALAPLPFRVAWIDGRDGAFPAAVPGNVTLHTPADPVAAVAAAPLGAFVLAMTHDHALDFAVVDAALRRPDFPFVGVIGSATKRARFLSRLTEIGHTAAATRRMVCPVGAGGPSSKRPAVIAAAVAVELLVADEVARNPQVSSRYAVVGLDERKELA